MVERVRDALGEIPAARRAGASVVYTAHSIPVAMSQTCDYVAQLEESSRLVSEALELASYELAYQSRSGPPNQPWLEPAIGDVLRRLHAAGEARDVVVVPIGFLSDHVEILWDLDTEARRVAQDRGLNMVRARTVGSHRDFVRMIRLLIEERVADAPAQSLGHRGPSHDECPADCCAYTPSRGRPA
jgi:ferrochelatase